MPQITVENSGSNRIITLDNPTAFNALAPNMIDGLVDALEAADADRGCRAVILTGAEERAFCAGIDVKSVASRDEAGAAPDAGSVDPIQAQYENLNHTLARVIRVIHGLAVPVIAAVNGHAIGAGFAIAAASDMRVVGDNVAFADGFVKRGISGCELGLSYFLPRQVGVTRAFEWMSTGRRIGAAEAEAAGFVNSVGAPDTTVDRAVTLGDSLAEIAPFAATMTKEVVWANLEAGSLDQALMLESRTQVMARNTADAAEARTSFLEKRSPSFGESDQERPQR